jgi:hypothetical protein
MTLDELRKSLTLVGQAIGPLESELPQADDPDRTALFQAEIHELRDRLHHFSMRLLVVESIVRIAGGEPPTE